MWDQIDAKIMIY